MEKQDTVLQRTRKQYYGEAGNSIVGMPDRTWKTRKKTLLPLNPPTLGSFILIFHWPSCWKHEKYEKKSVNSRKCWTNELRMLSRMSPTVEGNAEIEKWCTPHATSAWRSSSNPTNAWRLPIWPLRFPARFETPAPSWDPGIHLVPGYPSPTGPHHSHIPPTWRIHDRVCWWVYCYGVNHEIDRWIA